MADDNLGAVVVKEDGEAVGIFSERDLLKRVVARGIDPAHLPISEVVTRKVYCVNKNDSIRTALDKMHQGNFRHMPVMHKNEMVGFVSIRDLLGFYADL